MELRCRRPLILASVVAVAAFALLAAGCGGGGSPRVASVASSTTVAPTTTQTGAVAYSRCMRSHGVPTFPDPDSSGEIPKSQVVDARENNPTRFDAASSACGHLLPNGFAGAEQITRADQVDYLKAAACMRRHGIPDFPDPTFQNNGVKFNIPSSIDPNSSQVRSALPICRKLIPAGLPYSGSS
jgi:hypothetical protein